MAEPLGTPPPDGDVNRAGTILSILYILFICATIPLVLRVWVRLRMAGSLGWDDYTLLMDYAIAVIGVGVNTPMVIHGFGRHAYYLTMDQVVEARMYNQYSQLQNIVGVWLLKISVCIFLLRIVGIAHTNFRRFLWLLMGVNTAVNGALFIIWFLQCNPIYATWDLRVPASEKTCLPGSAVVGVAYMSAAFNMVTDIICALFPVFFLYNVQINRGRKIALITLTGFGLLTAVAALLKLVFLYQLVSSEDVTWAPVNVTICAIAEQYGSIFCAALPALKPLFSKVMHLTIIRKSTVGRSKRTKGSESPSFVKPEWETQKFTMNNTNQKTTVTSRHEYDEEELLDSAGITARTDVDVQIEKPGRVAWRDMAHPRPDGAPSFADTDSTKRQDSDAESKKSMDIEMYPVHV